MPLGWNVLTFVLDDTPGVGNNSGSLMDFFMPYMASQPNGNWVALPNGVCHMPQCGPSRATLMTGRYAHKHGVVDNAYSLNNINFGQAESALVAPVMAGAGYQTAMIGKYNNGYAWTSKGASATYQPKGWNQWCAISGQGGSDDPTGYNHYDLVENGVRTTYDGSIDSASYVTDLLSTRAVNVVQTLKEPFFAYVSFGAPHANALAPDRYASSYGPVNYPIVHPPNHNVVESTKPAWLRAAHPDPIDQSLITPQDDELRTEWRAMTAIDDAISNIMAVLSSRGLLSRTAVFFLGDNSDLFYEHRLLDKAVPYNEALRHHLRVRWPGATQRTDTSLVTTPDLCATWCDIAGARMPYAMDGMSLRPLLDGTLPSNRWRTHVLLEAPNALSGRPAWYGVRSTTQTYVEWADGSRELYDNVNDPYQLNNLYPSQGDAGLGVVLARLRAN